jgi:2-keto-4-pentenoate hydratase/2-oxohepta-3-ene-1,7-dioic acid hydratase in catechol pathway
MRTMLGMATATVLALMAGGAVADEVTGTISNIDLTRSTFTVEGKTFTASPNNTVGVKLEELKDGDTVRVDATNIETGKQPINAMSLQKVE